MINVFISHPSPFNEIQKNFLQTFEKELAKFELNPVNLGKNDWSYKNPLQPIKEMMDGCKGAIIIGLERYHNLIGYQKEGSEEHKEHVHRYESTPWIHIEAGMAYQKGLPLLIMKERKIFNEGILDPITSDYFIFEFEIEDQQHKLSPQMERFIESWAREITKRN